MTNFYQLNQRKYSILLFLMMLLPCFNLFSQNVGINATGSTPNTGAILHVDDTKAVLFDGGSLGSGTAMNLGSSIRMMWYPKIAFRLAHS